MDHISTGKKKERNGKIEFLRFVFCLAIVIFHGADVMTDGTRRILFSGRLGVEFFFLVSGCLMASAADHLVANPVKLDVGKETERYLLRKFKSLYPEVLIAFFLSIFAPALFSRSSIRTVFLECVRSLSSLLLLHQTGIKISYIDETWYLSAMMIAIAILFPLLLRFHSLMKKAGSCFIGTMLLGYLMMHSTSMASPYTAIGFGIYKGLLRAVSEMSLGIFVYECAKALQQIQFRPCGRILLAIVEFSLYAVILLYMTFFRECAYDFYIVFLLMAAVVISFSGSAWGSGLFNNAFCRFLGKASLYVYLTHVTAAKILPCLIGSSFSNEVRMLLYLLLSAAAAAVLWGLCQLFNQLAPACRRLLVAE